MERPGSGNGESHTSARDEWQKSLKLPPQQEKQVRQGITTDPQKPSERLLSDIAGKAGSSPRPSITPTASQAQQQDYSSRILYVRNLPFDVTVDTQQMFVIFSADGAFKVRQIRAGLPNVAQTRGTAYVVYEHALDARRALEKLSGFNVAGRYIVVSYYNEHVHRSNKRRPSSAVDEAHREIAPVASRPRRI